MKNTFFLVIAILLISCSNPQELSLVENSGYAQGSTYQIKYLTTGNRNYGEIIEGMFGEIDNSMSTWVPSSLISLVNKGDTVVVVDEMFLDVLNRSVEIAEESNGEFDPTVGPLVRLWGFGFDEIRGDINDETIDEVKSKIGYSRVRREGNQISIPEGFNLDFNAIAQGYTVDYIAEYLEKQGVSNYMVEVGGEIRTLGLNEKGGVWRIGVDKPQENIDSEERFQFILELKDSGLATSGNYRKFWVDEETGIKYAHTINPFTGRPAKNRLLSASIVAQTAMDADAYATVCMVKGLEDCKEFLSGKEELEGYLVYTNDEGEWETFITEGFQQYIVEQD